MIYLIRHGETEFNRDGRFQGRVDSPLTERGVIQARAIGARLAELAAKAPGAWRVVSSPLGRARRSAEIIAGAMGLPAPTLDERLIEVSYGDLEGLTRPEVDARWPRLAGVRGTFGRAPGGETMEALLARARSWLDEARREPGPVVAVAHASIGRALRGLWAGLGVDALRLLETPQDAFHRLDEAGVTRIDCPQLSPAQLSPPAGRG
jgi:probable phosphoglycerate mutase